MTNSRCRFCNSQLRHTFCDLGMSPFSNSYLKKENLDKSEVFYPLHAYVCESCFLVQLDEFQSPGDIFSDYAYFSSYSESWLKHCASYVEKMQEHFQFSASHLVVEIASNDGYLLQYFAQKKVPVLGIEPAANVAKIAESKGIPTLVKFFGSKTALELVEKGKRADLLIGNNVLAHVPNLNDFVEGMKILLHPQGIITMEFPHLLQLMRQNQFDTIYHEHFSYLSLFTVEKLFEAHGLKIFDVEEIETHGGSLRIYACHRENLKRSENERVEILREKESAFGMDRLDIYKAFSENIKRTKRKILDCLISLKEKHKSVVGYGAPAKGNTLLNYCGIGTDFLEYTVDRSPHKQGLYLPGTRIPIFSPEKIQETKPDYLLILPWNLKKEIMQQMSHIKKWEGKFLVLIPEVEII